MEYRGRDETLHIVITSDPSFPEIRECRPAGSLDPEWPRLTPLVVPNDRTRLCSAPTVWRGALLASRKPPEWLRLLSSPKATPLPLIDKRHPRRRELFVEDLSSGLPECAEPIRLQGQTVLSKAQSFRIHHTTRSSIHPRAGHNVPQTHQNAATTRTSLMAQLPYE